MGKLRELASPAAIIGRDRSRPDNEHVHITVGAHLATDGGPEHGRIGRPRMPGSKVLAQPVNELLTQARERDDVRRGQVIAIEAVQFRRACDGDVDDALPGQALHRAPDAVGRVASDYAMEAPPGERSVGPG